MISPMRWAAIAMVFINSECLATAETVYTDPPPLLIRSKPAPVYPEAARLSKIEGRVVVLALVGKNGRVKKVRIVQSVPGLDEAAMRAVKRWRFSPGTRKGKPTEMWAAVPVRFRL